MESTGLARLLFEIASDERLGILVAIREKPLIHARIGRQLKMTGSETTRHLNRLSAAGLVRRNPRGEFELTNLARVLVAGLPFFRFLTANREFLADHDVLVLPREFLERLGALSDATYVTGTYKVVAFQERSLQAVKRRIWVITEQAWEQAIQIMQKRSSEGADVRVIRPRGGFEERVPSLEGMQRNYPVRLLEETRIFLAVLDDVAGLCLPTHAGKVDMATMVLIQDPRGYGWAEALFQHYWNQAREHLV